MLPKCIKCKESLSNNYVLRCSICKKSYHTECAGRSEKLYLLMSMENKKTWTCQTCRTKKSTPSSASAATDKPLGIVNKSVGDSNNVTRRKKKKTKSPQPCASTPCSTQIELIETKKVCTPENLEPNEYEHNRCARSTSSPVSHIPKLLAQNELHLSDLKLSGTETLSDNSVESAQADYTDADTLLESCNPNRSCPDLRTTSIDDLLEYKTKIISLELRLKSAEAEIENLIIENSSLKRKIEDNDKIIKSLKDICTPNSKKSEKSKNKKPKDLSQLSSFSYNLNSTELRKQTVLECSTKDMSHVFDPEAAEQPHTASRSSSADTASPSRNPPGNSSDSCHTTAIPAKDGSIIIARNQPKTKLCIISNQKNKNSLQAIEHAFQTEANFCHYVAPNGSIKDILKNLDVKLNDFTYNDFCVIFIGSKDITSNENSINLVNYLRETLQYVTHTNVIITLPTFVCGALIYNYKVEMFNSLLTMDLQTHNYAYVFDTNYDLTLDMFSYYSGKITQFGLRNVFLNLKKYLTYFRSGTANPENLCQNDDNMTNVVADRNGCLDEHCFR